MEQKPQKDLPLGDPFDEIEGTLERFTFRNAETGFAVVRFLRAGTRTTLTAVGQLAQLAEGQQLRLRGKRIEHPRFGPQIEVQSVEAVLPTNVEGIRVYLASSLVKGVGQELATRITDRFGADTLRVIEEEPHRLTEVPGLGSKRSAELREALQSQRDVQEVMVFLRAHGLGQGLATRIVRRYGNGASALIQANPYRLAEEVIGIGFRTADRLAGDLGIARDAKERIQAGTLFTLSQSSRDGHCFLPQAELVHKTAELLSVQEAQVEAQLRDLELQGQIHPRTSTRAFDTGRSFSSAEQDTADAAAPCIYPSTLERAEAGVAECIQALLAGASPALEIEATGSLNQFEMDSGMTLPRGQRAAVLNALLHPISVITGGPGVGKTTIIRAVAEILARHNKTLLLCAPTGRAAKRLSESTRRTASTIHRLLDWQVGADRFQRDAETPLEGDVLVVDEASMLDVQLAYNLFRAIPRNMKLVLVGDVNQLPSVGPGQVLRDVIDSDVVAVTRLDQIFRQEGESQIVKVAHGLLEGQMPRSGDENSDFFYIEAKNNQHTRELIRELVVRRIPNRFGMDPAKDVQVLTPMYRGHAGCDTINEDLQNALNPGGQHIERGAKRFRVGDKVLQIRNDYDLDVFNGDLGTIRAVLDNELTVEFGQRLLQYPIRDLDALTQAYAITVHRSQGSEYPGVVIPLTTDHYMMLRRNLLYTAITRGKKLVCLVGTKRALEMAVNNDDEARRYSGLAERLRQ